MPNIQDRRVRKTRKQLRQAVATLLLQKPISKITVKELCEMIDINRATFYLHYQDVYDLVEKTEEELCNQFEELTLKHPLNQVSIDLIPLYNAIFELLLNEKEMALALLCGKSGHFYGEKIMIIFKDYFEYQWNHLAHAIDATKKDYAFYFIVSGCAGAIQYWLQTGTKESPQEMSTMLSDLVRNGVVNFGSQI